MPAEPGPTERRAFVLGAEVNDLSMFLEVLAGYAYVHGVNRGAAVIRRSAEKALRGKRQPRLLDPGPNPYRPDWTAG